MKQNPQILITCTYAEALCLLQIYMQIICTSQAIALSHLEFNILSNNCIFKICSWYQLSNFKPLLGRMTVQNATQLNPAVPEILFLTVWQRTMWAAFFVLASVLSFPLPPKGPLPQRSSSFIQLKLWYKATVPVVWSVLSTMSMPSSCSSFIGLWTFSHVSHFLTGISRP